MTTFITRQFKKEDLSKMLDTEPRFEDFISAINQTNKLLETIINGGIGLDNLNAQKIELSVLPQAQQPFPMKVKSTVKGRPFGLLVVQTLDTTTVPTGMDAANAATVTWKMDGATLLITSFAYPSATHSYKATLLLLGA